MTQDMNCRERIKSEPSLAFWARMPIRCTKWLAFLTVDTSRRCKWPEIELALKVNAVTLKSPKTELLIALKSQYHRLVRVLTRIQRIQKYMKQPRFYRDLGQRKTEEYFKEKRILIQHAQVCYKYTNKLECLKASKFIPAYSNKFKPSSFVDHSFRVLTMPTRIYLPIWFPKPNAAHISTSVTSHF